MPVIELIATAFGLISVWLTVRQNIWCWPTGLIMVSLYVYIFYGARLYSDMGLQVIYIFMQLYGWYHWLYGAEGSDRLPVIRLKPSQITFWTSTAAIGTLGLGWAMYSYTDAALPYWDATTTILSLIAQWLMARKVLESWLIWIAVDILAIGIYMVKGLYPTAILYAVFLGLATTGLLAWKKTMAPQPERA